MIPGCSEEKPRQPLRGEKNCTKNWKSNLAAFFKFSGFARKVPEFSALHTTKIRIKIFPKKPMAFSEWERVIDARHVFYCCYKLVRFPENKLSGS